MGGQEKNRGGGGGKNENRGGNATPATPLAPRLRLSLFGGFEQAENSVDKNSKKPTVTLDYWKLLPGYEFVQTQSIRSNEKCSGPVTVSI